MCSSGLTVLLIFVQHFKCLYIHLLWCSHLIAQFLLCAKTASLIMKLDITLQCVMAGVHKFSSYLGAR